ncbi:lactonase family protein [Spirilliplanes yamanashiensis]|nr:beta-propeller fold lactonase family protein [Spirilliplanes yamanashiensis]MDP9816010.1 6-phosphogluconolactonase (cycloisomerase 2 family) [Spirilliplanes yamanashiensis]
MTTTVVTALAAALVALVATAPTSGAAFRSTGAATSAAFAARASFGLMQTAPCFSRDGSGGCTAAIGVTQGEHVAVSPDGAHVYTASKALSAVAAFTREPAGGALTQLASPNACVTNGSITGCTTVVGLGGGVFDLAVSPDGKHVYATGYTSDAVAAFSRHPTTGVLTQLAAPNRCVTSGSITGCSAAVGLNGANGITISPDGAHVYVASYDASSLAVFARDATTGALTQLAGTAGCVTDTSAPISGCATARGLRNPYFLHATLDGTGVYVAGYGSNAISAFVRNPGTGAVTQPAAPNACVYNSASTAIAGCTAATGLLGTYHVQVAADGTTVYAAGYDGNTLAAFGRDPATGVLTAIGCHYNSGSTAVAGCTSTLALAAPTGVAVSPDGRSVFVSAFTSGAVAMFRRDPGTGLLTQRPGTDGCIAAAVAGCTTGSGLSQPLGLTASHDGRDVYVVGGNYSGQGAGWVTALNVNH